MRKRASFLGAAALSAGLMFGGFISAQQTAPQPIPGPSTRPGGGRRGGAPGIPDFREKYTPPAPAKPISYQPLPHKNARGDVVRADPITVVPISDAFRADYGINPFYKKMAMGRSVAVVASEKVTDWAVLECCYTLDHQLNESPQWLHDVLKKNKVRHAILSVSEFTMDLPENRGRNGDLANGAFQDQRSRGLGGQRQCSSGEENLLNHRGDPYGGSGAQGSGENITVHEFSHTVASNIGSAQGRDGQFWADLRAALASSKADGGRLEVWNRGRRGPVYASTNEQEYWAEGAQAWFDNANPNNSGGLSVRGDVKKKDPKLAALLTEIYGDGEWKYVKTTATNPNGTPMRPAAELAHLEGLDAVRDRIPVFNFNNSPRRMAALAQGITPREGNAGNRGRRGAATDPSTQPIPVPTPATSPARGN